MELGCWEKLATTISIIGVFNIILTVAFLFAEGKLNFSCLIDPVLADHIGTYLAGTSGTLWGAAGLIVLIQTLLAQKEGIQQQKKISDQQSFESYFFKHLELFDSSIKIFLEKNEDPIIRVAMDKYRKDNEEPVSAGNRMYNAFPEEAVEGYGRDLERDLVRGKNKLKNLKTTTPFFEYHETFLTHHFYYILDIIKEQKEAKHYIHLLFAKLPKEIVRFILYYTLLHKNEKLSLIRNLRIHIPITPLYHPSHAKLFKPEAEQNNKNGI